jgi:hypothetical protein
MRLGHAKPRENVNGVAGAPGAISHRVRIGINNGRQPQLVRRTTTRLAWALTTTTGWPRSTGSP